MRIEDWDLRSPGRVAVAPHRRYQELKDTRGREADVPARVAAALRWLERRGNRRNRDGMARYGIVSPKVFGVSVATVRQLGKELGPDHELAQALWATGWYEARMLCAFVDEPAAVTPAQMDRWAADFDNWAICDTICFHLFDRSPSAWKKPGPWNRRREEFALLAGLALPRQGC